MKYQILGIELNFRLPLVTVFDFVICVRDAYVENGGQRSGQKGLGTNRRREQRSTRGEGIHGTAREGRAVNIE